MLKIPIYSLITYFVGKDMDPFIFAPITVLYRIMVFRKSTEIGLRGRMNFLEGRNGRLLIKDMLFLIYIMMLIDLNCYWKD